MTVFCDEEETNTFEVPNEWSERKSHNNTSVCTITMCLQSDKCNIQLSCAHHDSIWERGGTAAHIINPVLLHTVQSDNILATTCIWSVDLHFSPQLFICYQTEQVTLSLIAYLDIPWSPEEVKNFLNLTGTLPQFLIHLSWPQTAKHTSCTLTATLLVSAYAECMCYSCKRRFSRSHFTFTKK